MSNLCHQVSMQNKNSQIKKSLVREVKVLRQMENSIIKQKYFTGSLRDQLENIDASLMNLNIMLESLGMRLIQKQIQVNASGQFFKLIKQYENKILQYRLQAQNKALDFEDLKLKQENIFHQTYYLPSINQIRKFFIESLHRQKLEKLLHNLKILQVELKQFSFNNFSQLPAQHKKIMGEKLEKRVIPKLITKIEEQNKRNSQLKQKYVAFKRIYEVLAEENKGILYEIKNKQNKLINNEYEANRNK